MNIPKLFNVQLVVRISLLGELDPPADPPAIGIGENLPDDPIKAHAVILERYANKLAPVVPIGPVFAGPDGPEGVSMNLNAKIAAHDFTELQSILKKFSDVLDSLTP